MFRFLFFLIVFYVIYKGFKFFIRAFQRGKQTDSFGRKKETSQDERNIEDAEFTEIESEIHTKNESKVDSER